LVRKCKETEVSKMKRYTIILLLVGLLLLPGLAYAQDEVLYGCNGGNNPSNLYMIDPATGAAVLVGPMGMSRCSGLAFGPNGILFAVGHDPDNPNDWSSLFAVDTATGAAMPLGEYHHSFGGGVDRSRISDLSFRSDGALYGYLEGDDGLGILEPGGVNELGPTNVSCGGNGIAFSPGDVLWHACHDGLNTLDQTNGDATSVAGFDYPIVDCPDYPRINALDFSSGGVLYGSLNCGPGGGGPNYLVVVHTPSGVVTEVGPTVDGLDGIAFVPLPPPPEPEFVPEWGSIALLGSGLMGLAGYASLRWRKR
jgi:hypothetical protein